MLFLKNFKIIVVNYYSVLNIRILLDSIILCASNKLSISICLVDNTHCKSQKTLLIDLLEQYTSLDIDLIFSKENLGYFGAAHYAIKREKTVNKYDFVALVNPDIEFLNFDFLHEVQLDRDIGLMSVNVVNQDLIPYNPFMRTRPGITHLRLIRFVSSYYLIYRVYELLHILKKSVKRRCLARPKGFSKQETVYANHGSIFIFTKEAMRKGFDFTYPGFLFLEELFVAEKMADMNLKTVYVDQVTAIHYEHHSIGEFKDRLMVSYLNQSINLFLNNLSRKS